MCVLAVRVCRVRGEGVRPTLAAKLYLAVAVLLSLAEEVPGSVLTVAACSHTGKPQLFSCCNSPLPVVVPCLLRCYLSLLLSAGSCCPCLGYFTAYDLVQVLGGVSLIFITLLVRSQYLRVQPVSCHGAGS